MNQKIRLRTFLKTIQTIFYYICLYFPAIAPFLELDDTLEGFVAVVQLFASLRLMANFKSTSKCIITDTVFLGYISSFLKAVLPELLIGRRYREGLYRVDGSFIRNVGILILNQR